MKTTLGFWCNPTPALRKSLTHAICRTSAWLTLKSRAVTKPAICLHQLLLGCPACEEPTPEPDLIGTSSCQPASVLPTWGARPSDPIAASYLICPSWIRIPRQHHWTLTSLRHWRQRHPTHTTAVQINHHLGLIGGMEIRLAQGCGNERPMTATPFLHVARFASHSCSNWMHLC